MGAENSNSQTTERDRRKREREREEREKREREKRVILPGGRGTLLFHRVCFFGGGGFMRTHFYTT